MSSFKNFLAENATAAPINEAKSDYMVQYKHNGGDRYEFWIKGLPKALKAAGVSKEDLSDETYNDSLGQEITNAITKALDKAIKTKVKDVDGKPVNTKGISPKKVIVQY